MSDAKLYLVVKSDSLFFSISVIFLFSFTKSYRPVDCGTVYNVLAYVATATSTQVQERLPRVLGLHSSAKITGTIRVLNSL